MEKLISIHPDCERKITEYQIPENIGFGNYMAPVMIEANYSNGQWGEISLKPYGPISLEPCAKVLHYGQEIFEGLKAYKQEGKSPRLFRPIENYNRFNFSARRLAMPEIPQDYFMEGIKVLTKMCEKIIPTKSGDSLYLRPFMFATETHVGIKPSSDYKFLIIASPCASYFSGDVKVLIQRKMVRAVRGGTGNAKCGGNYAASLLSATEAFQKGYAQTLWLDAIEHRFVEELSGMNFFAVINGELYTPSITETILNGITRDAIIKIAPTLDIRVNESHIAIDQLIKQIQNKKCTEIFACGTAAIISPLLSLCEDNGTEYKPIDYNGPVTQKLRNHLLNLQETGTHDDFGWSVEIK